MNKKDTVAALEILLLFFLKFHSLTKQALMWSEVVTLFIIQISHLMLILLCIYKTGLV